MGAKQGGVQKQGGREKHCANRFPNLNQPNVIVGVNNYFSANGIEN
jgi:hypothetical protein